MSEMLGNYYFQKRDYYSAILQYEGLPKFIHLNNSVKKKLIICYAQQNNVEKSLELFTDLISTDINIIVRTNHEDEMCPCPDLIYEFENNSFNSSNDFEQIVLLGILWLYCNIYKSFNYLNKASLMKPENKNLIKVLRIISDEIIQLEKKQNHNRKGDHNAKKSNKKRFSS